MVSIIILMEAIIREIFDADINITNIDTNNASASGQIIQVAINSSKKYALNNLIIKKFGDSHDSSMLYTHNLDYYPTKTSTCL